MYGIYIRMPDFFGLKFSPKADINNLIDPRVKTRGKLKRLKYDLIHLIQKNLHRTS